MRSGLLPQIFFELEWSELAVSTLWSTVFYADGLLPAVFLLVSCGFPFVGLANRILAMYTLLSLTIIRILSFTSN